MSLSQAVLEIAQQIEDKLTLEIHLDSESYYLRGLVRQLRSAVKAVEGILPAITLAPSRIPAVVDHKEKRSESEWEREMIRDDKGPRFVEVADGPLMDENVTMYHPVDPTMPVHARTYLGGHHIYELRDDGRLYYVPPRQDPS